MFISNQAKKSFLENCLNKAVENGNKDIEDIKKCAMQCFREKYGKIEFLLKQEVFKNYFGI